MTASPGPTLTVGVSAPTLALLRSPSTTGDHLFHDSADCPFAAVTSASMHLVHRTRSPDLAMTITTVTRRRNGEPR